MNLQRDLTMKHYAASYEATLIERDTLLSNERRNVIKQHILLLSRNP